LQCAERSHSQIIGVRVAVFSIYRVLTVGLHSIFWRLIDVNGDRYRAGSKLIFVIV
jgi:hypothetical protein